MLLTAAGDGHAADGSAVAVDCAARRERAGSGDACMKCEMPRRFSEGLPLVKVTPEMVLVAEVDVVTELTPVTTPAQALRFKDTQEHAPLLNETPEIVLVAVVGALTAPACVCVQACAACKHVYGGDVPLVKVTPLMVLAAMDEPVLTVPLLVVVREETAPTAPANQKNIQLTERPDRGTRTRDKREADRC